MRNHESRHSGIARLVAWWVGMVLVTWLAPVPAVARDEPPTELSPRERAEWWQAQCTKLVVEVTELEALRKDHEAGDRLMRTITLPSSRNLMYDYIQSLAREIDRRPPNDPARRQLTVEFNALHDQYVGRMNHLIPQDVDLSQRGIRYYRELAARSERWLSLEARYPLAKAERDRACEESDRARRELGRPLYSTETNYDRWASHQTAATPRGRVRNPRGVVEVWSAVFRKWKGPLTGEWPLYAEDRVRTGPNSSCLVEIYTPSGVPDTLLVGPESLIETPMRAREGRDRPSSEPAAETLLLDGILRSLGHTRRKSVEELTQSAGGWDSPFSVCTPTVCCAREQTDFILRHEARTKSDLVLVREGVVEVKAGGVVRELRAGQQVSARQSQLSSVKPLTSETWDRLVADKRLDPVGVAGSTGRIEDTPANPGDDAPRPPSNIPSSPTGVPSSPSPRGVTPGTDVTQRDLPSGPLPRGGETRLSGDTFTVQSAREFTTYQEITARAVVDFHAATQVRGSGSGLAGIYVTAAPSAENRPGDLFFGMDGAGIVLQRHDGAGWRDLPRQARGLAAAVHLEVSRRAGRYEFRWNGAPVGEAADAGGTMRVFLFAGPGVRAEFSRFSVVSGGTR